jgi:hypothetical protein
MLREPFYWRVMKRTKLIAIIAVVAIAMIALRRRSSGAVEESD